MMKMTRTRPDLGLFCRADGGPKGRRLEDVWKTLGRRWEDVENPGLAAERAGSGQEFSSCPRPVFRG
jgi:hypothetical protein